MQGDIPWLFQLADIVRLLLRHKTLVTYRTKIIKSFTKVSVSQIGTSQR